MTKFDLIYQSLLRKILTSGSKDINQRTKHETAALPGLTFTTDIQQDGFPLLTLRRIPTKLFIAEQIWFISGARKPNIFLRDFTKIWDDFTNPGDVITAAYGYRWRRHFGRDQLGLLVQLLKNEPSSRHGVVVAWDPASDGLGGITKKNVPCPYTFTVQIIGSRLHMLNVIRSNDMILGFPHDVAGFVLLQLILAQKLGVSVGTYTHTIGNAHIYNDHYTAAETLIKRKFDHKKIILQVPPDSFERAEHKDSDLVLDIDNQLQSQYQPQEAIKNIRIVL